MALGSIFPSLIPRHTSMLMPTQPFPAPPVSSSLSSLRSPCNVLSPHAIPNFIEQQREGEQSNTLFSSALLQVVTFFIYIRLHTVASIKYTCCFAPGRPPPPPRASTSSFFSPLPVSRSLSQQPLLSGHFKMNGILNVCARSGGLNQPVSPSLLPHPAQINPC